MNSKKKLAIIGSGISGLGAALKLQDYFDIDIFERQAQLGGHIRPRSVLDRNQNQVSVDTAFLGFKPEVYPNVTRLFSELGVEITPCNITGSVHINKYNHHFLRHLAHLEFGKRFPAEWQVPSGQFFALLIKALKDGYDTLPNISIADYLKQIGIPAEMAATIIIPDVASIWGVQPEDAAQMSVHGAIGSLLTVGKGVHRLKYSTQDYLDRITKKCRFNNVYLNSGIVNAFINENQKPVVHWNGQTKTYDKIVIATSAEQAAEILPLANSDLKSVLRSFNYVSTIAILHTHSQILNDLKDCRGFFNYITIPENQDKVIISWDLTSLCQLQTDDFVQVTTADPSFLATGLIPEDKILDLAFHRHCIPTPKSIEAQSLISKMNTRGPIHFCGSYFRPAATHEAALSSGLDVAKILIEEIRPS